MELLDYLVIIAFTILVVIAGLSFGRRGSDMKSYFAAGGAVPWSISGLSLYMSFFSAGAFVVWGSIAYEYGWVSITIQMTMCIGGFLVAYFIAPKWRETNVLTAAEFVRRRLGESTQKFLTYCILVISLFNTGAFLYPVAKIVNVSTGWPINACIIGLGLLILVYTIVGGLWAVIITDALQFVILTAAVCITVVLSLETVGGFDAFVAKVPDDFWNWTNAEYDWSFMLAFIIFHIIFIGGNWAYVQRFTSVKSKKDAKKVGLTFSWLYLVSPIIWMLPAMIYKAINPDLSGLANEGAYIMICKLVLPAGLLGLMLGGMVFATASSVNTTLNLAASIMTNDLFKLFRPDASQQVTMRVAKLSTLFFGLATILIALMVPAMGGIVNVVLSVGAVTGCSLYGPPIWALFSKRQTGRSVLFIAAISLSINIAFKFLFSLSRPDEMLLGALLPFVLLASYELWAIYRERHFSEDYVNYEKNRAQDIVSSNEAEQNSFGLKVLANTLLVVSAMMIGLELASEKTTYLIALVGLLILGISLYMHPSIKFKKS